MPLALFGLALLLSLSRPGRCPTEHFLVWAHVATIVVGPVGVSGPTPQTGPNRRPTSEAYAQEGSHIAPPPECFATVQMGCLLDLAADPNLGRRSSPIVGDQAAKSDRRRSKQTSIGMKLWPALAFRRKPHRSHTRSMRADERPCPAWSKSFSAGRLDGSNCRPHH